MNKLCPQKQTCLSLDLKVIQNQIRSYSQSTFEDVTFIIVPTILFRDTRDIQAQDGGSAWRLKGVCVVASSLHTASETPAFLGANATCDRDGREPVAVSVGVASVEGDSSRNRPWII